MIPQEAPDHFRAIHCRAGHPTTFGVESGRVTAALMNDQPWDRRTSVEICKRGPLTAHIATTKPRRRSWKREGKPFARHVKN
jgi:hypothetical protein